MLTLSPAAITTCGEAREQPELIGRHDNELIKISKPPGKTSVRIINEVGAGVTVAVHCKSGDDDLGPQSLAPHGSFGFKFYPRFFVGTLFHCQIGWPNNPHLFDAYVQSRDAQRCYFDCCWNVTPAGPCDCHSGECFKWND